MAVAANTAALTPANRRLLLRRGALPVVQVEEHRRALGRGLQQLSKLTQHVRPDRLAFVLRHVVARQALPGEHIEMVEPEVDHHFFELPVAVGRAQQFLLRQLQQHLPFAADLWCWRGSHHLGLWCCAGLRIGAGPLLFGPRALRGNEVLLGELTRARLDRRQRFQPRAHRRVVDLLGVELLLDVGLETGGADTLDVSRHRPEADPVQHVDDGAVVGILRDRRLRAAGEDRAVSRAGNHAAEDQGQQ